MTRPRLSVIVPFRDRHEHLRTLLPVLAAHLRAIPHRVTVVEQADRKPFNKGKLMNAGASLASDCDYYCFHDVDLVPAWSPGQIAGYGFTRSIAHLVGRRLNHDGRREPVPSAPNCLGGVVLGAKRVFDAINGFSNEYWGWGHEDNDLYARAVLSGMRITHRPYPYRSLLHAAPYRCNHAHWEANCARYERMARGDVDYMSDGLNSLSYSLVARETRKGCDWITVLT